MISVEPILKGMTEFILMMLMGQGLVYLMSFGRHDTNAVYLMFRFLNSPVIRAVRVITPNQVSDKHVPFVGFFLLFWIYVVMFVEISFVAAGLPSSPQAQ